MTTAVSDTLTSINNDTAKTIDSNNTVTGSASASLTSTEFLSLIIQQLQYQDPLEPTDNAEFVSQTCQLSQLQSTQNNTATTTEQQATSLVGENVTLKDPKDLTKRISGDVTSATIDGEDSAITVNGTSYPLKYLVKVNQVTTAATTDSTANSAAADSAAADSATANSAAANSATADSAAADSATTNSAAASST